MSGIPALLIGLFIISRSLKHLKDDGERILVFTIGRRNHVIGPGWVWIWWPFQRGFRFHKGSIKDYDQLIKEGKFEEIMATFSKTEPNQQI